MRPPVTDRQARALLNDELIARAYLGPDPAAASAADWRRARAGFGRPLGLPQVMPDGAVRQTFEWRCSSCRCRSRAGRAGAVTARRSRTAHSG